MVVIALFACVGASAQARLTAPDRLELVDFSKRVENYSKMRADVQKKLPKLPKKATAEQIEAHEKAFRDAMLTAWNGARQGDLFTPEASRVMRMIVKQVFGGPERATLRQTVFEAENKAVPVKVNAIYPESQELLQMPPSLLEVMPKLPEHLRYRFVGTNMLLTDRDNNLIVDFMTNALP
jgi:hypothetical protein